MILGAEDKTEIRAGGAGKRTGGIIIGITEYIWTPFLEKSRVNCSVTARSQATVLIVIENCTWVVTPTRVPQFIRARPVNVARTIDPSAIF